MNNAENNDVLNNNSLIEETVVSTVNNIHDKNEKIGIGRILIIVFWIIILLLIMYFGVGYLKNSLNYYNTLDSITINGIEVQLEKDVYSYNIDCNNCQYLTQDLIVVQTHGKNTTVEKQVLDNTIFIRITGQKGGERQYTFIF